MIYTACKSLAKWWGMFLGTSHFDLEGWQKNPPVGFFRGAHSPLELQISLEKSNLCKFLMDSKDLYIRGSVKTYTFYKNSGHLGARQDAAILDLASFWTFFKNICSSCVQLVISQVYVVNSDAAYSAEETINKI